MVVSEALYSVGIRMNAVKQSAIDSLFQNMRDSATVLLLFPLMVGYSLWGEVTHSLLIGWLFVAETVGVSRLWLYLNRERILRAEARQPIWLGIIVVSSLSSGLTWGSTSLLFFQQASSDAIIVMNVIVVGLAAGSAVASNYWLPYFFAFTLSSLGLFGLYYLSRGDDTSLLLAVLYFIYLSMLTGLARFMHSTYWENLHLRMKNEDLVDELKNEKAAVEKASQAKTRFLAAASHDLRQPVHSLALFSGALEDEVNTRRGTEVPQHLDGAIESLNQLLSSLLDISKLDAGVVKPHVRPVPLQPLLRGIVDEMRLQAQEKGLVLRARACEHLVESDPALLGNIVRNLIGNAINYSEHGGVLLGCRDRGDKVLLQVWDTGRGIADTDREAIFIEFCQLNNPERDRSKGLGLGLAICRRLSSLLGHGLYLRSDPGHGSVFSIELPVSAAGENYAELDDKERKIWDLSGRTFLVIDDELSVREGMRNVLERWGCKALLAGSVEDAVAVAMRHARVDAVVSDYRLRENRTGVEAILAVQKAIDRSVPAVLVTGDTDPKRIQEARESGFVLLHKPVKAAQMRSVLGSLLITADSVEHKKSKDAKP